VKKECSYNDDFSRKIANTVLMTIQPGNKMRLKKNPKREK